MNEQMEGRQETLRQGGEPLKEKQSGAGLLETEKERDDVAGEAIYDVQELVGDLERLAKSSSPQKKEIILSLWGRLREVFRGVTERLGLSLEGGKAAAESVRSPSAENLEQARSLLVRFENQPTTEEMESAIRTLWRALGLDQDERFKNAAIINEAFGSKSEPTARFHAPERMETLRLLFEEAKRSDDTSRAPLYEQAIRLTHAIQGEFRRPGSGIIFLKDKPEYFSKEGLREEAEKLAAK